jgi:CDP-diacylglycerol--glycerol-3-phosphate 3-phosphatidyltransferase
MRLVFTIAVFICLERIDDAANPNGALAWWAFGLFLFAAVTDFADGYLARRFNQVSMFGRVFDPFADKVLICGTFVVLLDFPALASLLPSWFVVVVISRELLVTTVRGAAEARGIPFPADRLGKWKMVAQCVTASAAEAARQKGVSAGYIAPQRSPAHEELYSPEWDQLIHEFGVAAGVE